MPLADVGIGYRYRKPIPTFSNRYQHVDVGIGYCRYWVPFRTLTVPDTVTVIDTGIRYRYLNGRTLAVGTRREASFWRSHDSVNGARKTTSRKRCQRRSREGGELVSIVVSVASAGNSWLWTPSPSLFFYFVVTIPPSTIGPGVVGGSERVPEEFVSLFSLSSSPPSSRISSFASLTS